MPTDATTQLSVVITTVGGPMTLEACIRALLRQCHADSVEIIVPYESTQRTIAALQREFPRVRFVDMGVVETEAPAGAAAAAHEIYDRCKAVGLAAARGNVLALLDDEGIPDPDWCEQVLIAHRLPWSVIGGAIEHSGDGAVNWATYFQDFVRYQRPLTEGPTESLSDVNISYKREVLESVRSYWETSYNEARVNGALTKRGIVLWQRPQIVVRHTRGQRRFVDAASERFAWGCLFGRIRATELPMMMRLGYAALSPAIPLVIIWRIAWKVFATAKNRRPFLLSLPATFLLTTIWCLGECLGYVRPEPHSHRFESMPAMVEHRE